MHRRRRPGGRSPPRPDTRWRSRGRAVRAPPRRGAPRRSARWRAQGW